MSIVNLINLFFLVFLYFIRIGRDDHRSDAEGKRKKIFIWFLQTMIIFTNFDKKEIKSTRDYYNSSQRKYPIIHLCIFFSSMPSLWSVPPAMLTGGNPCFHLLELGYVAGNGDSAGMVEAINLLGASQQLLKQRVIEVYNWHKNTPSVIVGVSDVDSQVALGHLRRSGIARFMTHPDISRPGKTETLSFHLETTTPVADFGHRTTETPILQTFAHPRTSFWPENTSEHRHHLSSEPEPSCPPHHSRSKLPCTVQLWCCTWGLFFLNDQIDGDVDTIRR